MAVAKTIELFGVNGVKMKPMLDQSFDYRPPRDLKIARISTLKSIVRWF
jgi:hypothetical protein